jgi:DNA repair protein RecO (recombination protein O)
MLGQPAFLLAAPGGRPEAADLAAAFRLTGFFLTRHVYEPRGLPAPAARERFLALVVPTGP